ncbi:MAG: preprotein translocase subunit YajC [Spirochaetaceae bacterium]|nr:MAG: preprotein translocase subunit YajC [Spirochaetaceae bacterium]
MGAPGGAGASGGATSIAPTLVTFGLVFAIFYFLIIRPQNKRQKQTQQMLQALKKGDRVVTIGGIRGTIFSLKEDTAVLKVDDNTKIQFSRSAISQVIDKKAAAAEAATDSAGSDAETDAK